MMYYRRIAAVILSVMVWAVVVLGTEPAAITETMLREHLGFLASAELRGRMALELGSDIAARYIATQFRDFGIQPGMDQGDYFQPVPVETFSYQQDQSCALYWGGQQRLAGDTLSWDTDFYVFPRKKVASMWGQVVWCGYGIQAPEAGYDDYKGVDVSGKVVVALLGKPEADDSAHVFGPGKRTRHEFTPVKAKLAEKLGAQGLILTTIPARREAVWEPAISGKQAYWDADVIQAVGDEEFPVVYLDPECANKLANMGELSLGKYIQELDEELTGSPVTLQDVNFQLDMAYTDVVVDTVVNVIGKWGDAKPSGEAVIVGAHYDHVGAEGETIYFGADDNASGVSAMLAMAERLASQDMPLSRQVYFIAFGAEEEGLIGSRYYVDHPVYPLDRTVAMVNLDCIGREGAASYGDRHRPPETEEERNLLFAFYSAQYPNLKELVQSVPNPSGLTLRCDPLYGRHAMGDHAPFLERGVPVLFFFSGFHADYHTPNDTIDRIVFPKMTKVANLIYHVTMELAKMTVMLEPVEVKASPSPGPMY